MYFLFEQLKGSALRFGNYIALKFWQFEPGTYVKGLFYTKYEKKKNK